MKIHKPTTVEEGMQLVHAAYKNKQALRITTGKPTHASESSWLFTEHWRQWHQFDVQDMVLSVASGMPLHQLHQRLAEQGMRIKINGWFQHDTIGSAFAAHRVGPDRTFDGGIRDAVIGIEYIDATGRLVKAGGQVVKNVTGYDVMRMMLGSRGALGVITKLNFKMMPAPIDAQTLIYEGEGVKLLAQTKQLNLARLPLDWCAIRGHGNTATMALGISGNATRRQRLQGDLQRMLGSQKAMFAEDDAPATWAWTAPAQRLSACLQDLVLAEHQLHLNVRLPPSLLYESHCKNVLFQADAYQIHPFSADFHLAYRDVNGAQDIQQMIEPLAQHGGAIFVKRATPGSAWHAHDCIPKPANAALIRKLYQNLDPHAIFSVVKA